MTEEEMATARVWIEQAESTNSYCERSLLVEALSLIELGDIEAAAKRLRQVIPLDDKSELVQPPSFLDEIPG